MVAVRMSSQRTIRTISDTTRALDRVRLAALKSARVPTGAPADQRIEDLGDPGAMRGAPQNGTPGRGRVAELVPGDRRQQERLDQPGPPAHPGRAIQATGFEFAGYLRICRSTGPGTSRYLAAESPSRVSGPGSALAPINVVLPRVSYSR